MNRREFLKGCAALGVVTLPLPVPKPKRDFKQFKSVQELREYVRNLPSYEWAYSSKPIYYTRPDGTTYQIPQDEKCRYITGDQWRHMTEDGYIAGILWTYTPSPLYSHWEVFTFVADRAYQVTNIGNVNPLKGYEDFRFDW